MKNFFSNFFNSNSNNPNRRHIKDVKPGEDIQIEWYRIKGEMGWLKCINNDPETKKILLEVTWANKKGRDDEKEKIILDYGSKELKNFNLLNPIGKEDPKKEEDNNNFTDEPFLKN